MTDALLAGHRFEIVRGAVPGVPLKPDPSAALAIAAGIPAKVRREVTPADRERLEHAWRTYAALRDLHKSGTQY